MARPSRRSNQERREQSTEQVLASALKFFVTRGYGATSIDDIARDAGLTKGAVYFYFKGKAVLLLELLSQSTALYEDIFKRMRESDAPASVQLETTSTSTATTTGTALMGLMEILILTTLPPQHAPDCPSRVGPNDRSRYPPI